MNLKIDGQIRINQRRSLIPLNPPSYLGHDLWFSPDTYINSVPVALYQPPQIRQLPPSAKALGITIEQGEDLQFQPNQAQAQNQTAAFNQKLVESGEISAPTDALGKGTGTASSSPTNNSSNQQITSNDTGGVQDMTSFSRTLPLSRNFMLGQLVTSLYGGCTNYWDQPGVSEGMISKTGSVSAPKHVAPGQLVANAKLLCINVLDPIKDQFNLMQIHSCIRPVQNKVLTSQHLYFQACDFGLPKMSDHFACAQWIQKSAIPYDQLLLEYCANGSWVHVSYAVPPIAGVGAPNRVYTCRTNQKNNPYYEPGLINYDAAYRIS